MTEKRSVPGVKFIWQQSDIDFLKNNYKLLNNRQLADALNITLTICRMKLYELGIKRMEMEYWKPEMITYLKRNYKKMGDVELAERFTNLYPKNKPWTKKHIEKKRRYLNLKRTEEQQIAINQRNTKQGRNPGYWVSHQHLICEVGTIKIYKNESGRIYKAIKTKNGFVHYAPWLYKKEVGPIKPGHVIRIKDGNPLNVVVENLEMISWQQNAILNTEIRMSYPEELKEMIKLTNKLKKTIKKHEQH
jgi:hypothetical protein